MQQHEGEDFGLITVTFYPLQHRLRLALLLLDPHLRSRLHHPQLRNIRQFLRFLRVASLRVSPAPNLREIDSMHVSTNRNVSEYRWTYISYPLVSPLLLLLHSEPSMRRSRHCIDPSLSAQPNSVDSRRKRECPKQRNTSLERTIVRSCLKNGPHLNERKSKQSGRMLRGRGRNEERRAGSRGGSRSRRVVELFCSIDSHQYPLTSNKSEICSYL